MGKFMRAAYLRVVLHGIIVCLLTIMASTAFAEDIDYSQQSNWAYYGIGDAAEKPADLFIVCPTVDMGRQGNRVISLADEKMRGKFVGALNMERGIYEENTRMFAPYYRQVAFPVYDLSPVEQEKYLSQAYADVREAFRYYLENLNEGRPIVLAGFSQGADMTLRLMKGFFDDKALQEKLVAAYAIGWRLTEEEVKEYPWLRIAQGERDTGVIIIYNTEKVGVEESKMIPRGVKTLAVNPLNWRQDSEPAGKELNLGGCFTTYSGAIKEEIPEITGAYIDEKRGSLIVTDIWGPRFPKALTGKGSYHVYDFQFFFRNLQKNVGDRIEAYLESHESH
ncbi:MAG: DUF3089 domain-containing protein [Selenomonadaceae bacterium]|nr:DUF3089 domain-containing protein [Selenomonadaceae bacterium]